MPSALSVGGHIVQVVVGEMDRQETEQEIQFAAALLGAARVRFASLGDLDDPKPNSVLSEERKATAYEPIHTIVVRHRSRAVDNLERTFDLMFDDGQSRLLAYPYSLYSLIRAAIESAALALWVITPNTKAARVIRSLQLTYRDTQERLQFTKLIADDADITVEQARCDGIIVRLTELKNTVGSLRQRTLTNPPKYGDVLRSLSGGGPGGGGRQQFGLDSPLVAWKISTAFIHGSSQVVQALSDFRQLTEFTDGIASAEVTPSLRVLAGTIHAAVDLITRADDRYGHLATHDYVDRPVGQESAGAAGGD